MSSDLSKLTNTSIKADLLHFYDEFVELNDYCSFMCEAFASLATEEDYMDESTAMGVSRFCYWIKHRMEVLKGELKQIHEKSVEEGAID